MAKLPEWASERAHRVLQRVREDSDDAHEEIGLWFEEIRSAAEVTGDRRAREQIIDLVHRLAEEGYSPPAIAAQLQRQFREAYRERD